MCGIAGIFSYRGGADPADGERLSRLSQAMRRRGPDGEGAWTSPDGLARFAHRRLAIIDLSPAGNQPMLDADSGCALVFNGEIYNFRALREELVRAGHGFRSESDSEVLLRGYLHWGEGLLQRLRGMFAFALWDPAKRGLWLARDPYGIKPLYYADQAGRFAFASQVQPLRTSLVIDIRPEPAAVVGFLLMGSVPEPHTVCRGIRALPAGHALWVTARGAGQPTGYASVGEVWCMAARRPERLGSGELLDRVRAAVTDSVVAHQVADVPVGAFLSAGIDSGALVGLMAENRTAQLQTVTLGFSRFRGTGLDEVAHAERMATRYGAQQHTVWISDAEAAADLPRALADMDQPSVDGFNTWLVSKHTAALGLKVVVSGVGGDELFGGYAHFAQLPLWRRRLQRLARVPGLLPLLAGGLGLASRFGLVHAKAAALGRLGPDLAGLYLVRRGLFMPWELPALLDADLVREGLAALDPPHFLQTGLDPDCDSDYARIAVLEASNYLRNQLLRDSDWASMAHSLELRTPLVDFHLLRELAPVLAAPRPVGLTGKRALALAPRPALPNTVIDRPKSGFSLPMGDWLERTPLLERWRSIPLLNHPRCHWSRRMAYALAVQLL
ncbi:asparagine synthase (glutamine-hydrolyzing) [Candidatus Thiodictyon syntrophicum]|uniref:asparagine synthase (glutamine-hydrolyzing) n=1 Tax=Candidatus Thiodictyon syntrophicum TaxID=1166950 RepID=A0A2K8UFH0_9GAMM|nr:asparagine synthase (glutamine-hydrolyzing) [Candidatus Thiodictyon syntrophicum]AUB83861.1 asparagine synthase (glutamine-hydrolyzing) [Candidatus Thiodictyon syntrophicum]